MDRGDHGSEFPPDTDPILPRVESFEDLRQRIPLKLWLTYLFLSLLTVGVGALVYLTATVRLQEQLTSPRTVISFGIMVCGGTASLLLLFMVAAEVRRKLTTRPNVSLDYP